MRVVLESIENFKNKVEPSGSTTIKEADGYCATTAYVIL